MKTPFTDRNAIQRKLTIVERDYERTIDESLRVKEIEERRMAERYSETRMRRRVKKGEETKKKDTKKFHRCNATWPFPSLLLECLCDLTLYNSFLVSKEPLSLSLRFEWRNKR